MQVEVINTDKGVHELLINNKSIGEYVLDADGYYYFWENPNLKGSWNSNALRVIADEMDKLNKEWDEHLQKYFGIPENII